MSNITLKYRMIINGSNTSPKVLLLFENAKPFLQGLLHRLWSENPSMTWDDVKNAYPPQIKNLHSEITAMAVFYLRGIKPKLPNLLDRQQLRFSTFEVEISNLEFNLNNFELTVYFFSDEYRLIEKFGHYLLLSPNTNQGSQETFMVELNSDISIHRYTG